MSTIELPRAVGHFCHDNQDIRFVIAGREPVHEGVEVRYPTSAPHVCLLHDDIPILR